MQPRDLTRFSLTEALLISCSTALPVKNNRPTVVVQVTSCRGTHQAGGILGLGPRHLAAQQRKGSGGINE